MYKLKALTTKENYIYIFFLDRRGLPKIHGINTGCTTSTNVQFITIGLQQGKTLA